MYGNITTLLETLKEESKQFIMNYDFIEQELNMRESSMLCYIINLADWKKIDIEDCNREIEISVSFVKRKRPNWSESEIRKALKTLCEKGFLTKVGNHGRGNVYELNQDKILQLAKYN